MVIAGAAARGPRNRIAAVPRRGPDARSTCAPTRSTRPSAAGAAARLETVYLGGGTPSLLPADDVARLLARVRERFGIADGAEITLEANPGPDERGDPAALRRAGVTRLSFGAQSLDDAELRRLGRRHRAGDVADAVAAARAAGIGSSTWTCSTTSRHRRCATWMATLDAALALEPDHLSLYALTLDDPDAEGLTGPAGDHLPLTNGRAALARRRAAPARTRTAPPRSTTTRPSTPRRGRLPRLRDLELGATRPREPAQPRVLAAPAVRGRRARARTRSTASRGAGTRPGWTATSPR